MLEHSPHSPHPEEVQVVGAEAEVVQPEGEIQVLISQSIFVYVILPMIVLIAGGSIKMEWKVKSVRAQGIMIKSIAKRFVCEVEDLSPSWYLFYLDIFIFSLQSAM